MGFFEPSVKQIKYLFIVLFIAIFTELCNGGTPDPSIRRKLLETYDQLAQPFPQMTTVTIPYISVIHYDIDDQLQTFEVHAWIVMTWRDERLRWYNYSLHDYSGYLHFARSEIWTPEITTYNTAKPTVMNDFADEAQVLVQSNGTVVWVPPVRFITNCKMNLLQWPFDQQKCHIKIGSWTFNENELDLQFDRELSADGRIKVMSYEGHSFPNNTQWIIQEFSAIRTAKKYSCCAEKYVDITYHFTLGRKSSIFTFTVVLPVLMLTVVSLVCFLLPLNGSSRLTIAGIDFLVITAYMIYFRLRLPTIDHVPAIVRFFTWNLFMTTTNITVNVILLNVIIGKASSKIPDWAKVLLNSKFISYVSFGDATRTPRPNPTVKTRTNETSKKTYGSERGGGEREREISIGENNEYSGKAKNQNWMALIELFDKVCFAIFAIISFIMAVTLLV